MRKSKEERVIEHGEYIIKELHRVYKEGIGIDEYYKLLKEYRRLYKRQEKMIKLSDNMGGEIMEKNDTLSDNLQYTIKTARTKLMDNVSEHRKTKETSSKFQLRSKDLETALKESYEENSKLEKKLRYYIENYGEVKHSFNEEVGSQPTAKIVINPAEYKNMTIKQVVSMELSKDKTSFGLAKISLNNFNAMIDTIEQSSSINNFLLGTYKYLKNSFQKEDIVFHDTLEAFYIITRNKDSNAVKLLMQKLNKKRKVLNFDIIFSIGMTHFIPGKDTEEIFLRRCENAFIEAQQDETNIVVK